jgi:hypothetical protein
MSLIIFQHVKEKKILRRQPTLVGTFSLSNLQNNAAIEHAIFFIKLTLKRKKKQQGQVKSYPVLNTIYLQKCSCSAC